MTAHMMTTIKGSPANMAANIASMSRRDPMTLTTNHASDAVERRVRAVDFRSWSSTSRVVFGTERAL